MATKLYSEVLTKGDVFWQQLDAAYLPAVASGDAAAVSAALPGLKESFHVHETAVNELVELSNAYLKTREEFAAAETAQREMLALGGGAALTLTTLGAVLFIRRQRAENRSAISAAT